MFDKAQKLWKIKKMQDELKKQMEQIFVHKEKNGMEILVRGDRKIEKIVFDGVEDKELRDFLNEAMKEMEKKLEKQFKNQGGDLLSALQE